MSDDLIERCAQAAAKAFGFNQWDEPDKYVGNRKDTFRALARAVLEAAAHQPPAQAPITADDVLAAERAWWLSEGVTDASRAAFVADWLNRARTEPTTGETT